jgi:hypothetical protein
MSAQLIICRVILPLSLAILLWVPAASSVGNAAGPWYVAPGGDDANS